MATFQEIRTAIRMIDFLDRVRTSLRFEAQSYISTLNAGTVLVNGVPTPSLGVVQEIITRNRVNLANQVTRYQTFVGDTTNRATLVAGLAALGVALSEATALVSAMSTAITTHQNSSIATDPLIKTMAASVLATVPTYPSVVPEL